MNVTWFYFICLIFFLRNQASRCQSSCSYHLHNHQRNQKTIVVSGELMDHLVMWYTFHPAKQDQNMRAKGRALMHKEVSEWVGMGKR